MLATQAKRAENKHAIVATHNQPKHQEKLTDKLDRQEIGTTKITKKLKSSYDRTHNCTCRIVLASTIQAICTLTPNATNVIVTPSVSRSQSFASVTVLVATLLSSFCDRCETVPCSG